ncbi:MAG: hypothetical protein IJ794_16785 [Lachnospiraceae bacterium]|nr:hypothetical protein [Lachnospiraceae bacterium]
MNQLDKMLFDALLPQIKPDEAVNRKIEMAVEEKRMELHDNRRHDQHKNRRQVQTAAAIAAAVFVCSSVTAFAAWRYLSPREMAQELEDDRLAAEFAQNNRMAQGETQSCGGYDITLLGMVSGAEISDFSSSEKAQISDFYAEENISYDKTYIAVAIAHTDGTPMPGTQDADYDPTQLLVSPYIKGLDPVEYNAYTLGGGFSDFVKDGVEYRILETTNVEAFADRVIYVGVSDGMTYNERAFAYDRESGEISRRTDYQGVNALFVLPVDIAKADKERAAEILEWVEHGGQDGTGQRDGDVDENANEKIKDENGVATAEKSGFTAETEEFMAKLTVNNIDSYAEPIESTRQTIKPDEADYITYRYELPDGAGGSGTTRMDFLFEPGEYGMSKCLGYSADGGELENLRIETWTRNEDGSVTFVVYVPRR